MYSRMPINPIIKKKLNKWDRVEILLEQDEDKIKEKFCMQLPNEQEKSWAARKDYYNHTFINITQDLISAPTNAIFGQSIKEDYGEESSMLYQFSKNVALTNDEIPFSRYLRDFVGMSLRAYGNIFTVIDKPRYLAKSKADERVNGMPYLSNIRPQDVLNWQMADGKLLWFAYKIQYVPVWEDPLAAPPDGEDLECIWTINDFIVTGLDGKIRPELSYTHSFGFVPVIIQSAFLPTPNSLIGNASMDQTSNMIITFNNLLNVGVYELYKHGGSLLLMPDDAMTGTNFAVDATGDTKLKKQDNDGILTYAGLTPPAYLVKTLEVEKMMEWAKFYVNAALDNERDLKSVIEKGTGDKVIAQSGISKMVDREPIENNLVSHAEDIEQYAQKVFKYFGKIMGKENEAVFEFDKDFDVRSFEQKMSEIKTATDNGIKLITATGYKELWRNTVGDITADMGIQEDIVKEIEEFDVDKTEELINGIVDKTNGYNKFEKEE